ncbi:MAG: zinc ribbon domain-containing protein [Acidimicrobiales bacterium]|nr:zinc ribbon domain-containing protein [Acidimicrobiales bacterium]
MAHGTNDGRGIQPPRTLFSLGRPGSKTREEDVAADTLTEAAASEEIQYACGACGALLPTGAAFCGECGTPVAIEGVDDYSAYEEDHGGALAVDASIAEIAYGDAVEVATADAETLVAEAEHSGTSVVGVESGDAAGPDLAEDFGYDQLVEEPGDVPNEPDAPVEPAAVLYADPSVVEPLPAPAEGSWGVAEPLVGTAADDTLVTETVAHSYSPPQPPAPEVPAALVGTAPPSSGPPTSTGAPVKKSNKGMIIGVVAAAVVLLVVIAAVAMSGGSKKEDVATGESTTTTAATTGGGDSPSTTKGQETTTTNTTAGESSSTTEAAAPSTASTAPTTAPTTAPSAAPTTPAPTAPPTTPAPPPGNIVPSIPNGARINIAKGGSTTLTLRNDGGMSAQFILRGNKVIVEPAQGNIGPGGAQTVTLRAAAGAEGDASVSGALAGFGNYNISVFILNG